MTGAGGAGSAREIAALDDAMDVDDVARRVVLSLTALPGVRTVGLGLNEGGGRRLRFTENDQISSGLVDWCHIDAYEDLPLTAVVRTEEPILATLDALEGRYAALVDRQRSHDVVALAAVPLPGTGSPLGGLLLFYDSAQPLDSSQHRKLRGWAEEIADALRRVRAATPRRETTLSDEAEAQESDAQPSVAQKVEAQQVKAQQIEAQQIESREGQIRQREHRVADAVVEGHVRAAGEARRFLRRRLVEWHVDEDVSETAVLCLSELVTNAIIHTGSPSEVRAVLEDGVLTVTVRDEGSEGLAESADIVGDPDPLRVHGRGLQLLDALASRWGSERDAVGTTVWFALDTDQTGQTDRAS